MALTTTIAEDALIGSTVLQLTPVADMPLKGVLFFDGYPGTYRYRITATGDTYTASLQKSLTEDHSLGSMVTIENPRFSFFTTINDPAADDWTYIDFEGSFDNLKIVADIDNEVYVSYDGLNIDGTIRSGCAYALEDVGVDGIYYKGTATGYVDVFAWKSRNMHARRAL